MPALSARTVFLLIAALALRAAAEGPVVVALVDTGVDAGHPDLAEALVEGKNVAERGAGTGDAHGHGTAMAGLIAGRAADPARRGWAADANVRVMPIRVTRGDAATADADTLAAGILAALDAGAAVVCVPFGAPCGSESLENAVAQAEAKGALVIAAAGRAADRLGGFDACPAALPWAVSCTAGLEGPLLLPRGRGAAAGESRGARVAPGCVASGRTDLLLPGEAEAPRRGGGYETISGTSVACARAAALAAILRAGRRDLDAKRLRAVLLHAGSLPENPADQDLGRLRQGGRAGVGRWAQATGAPCDLFLAAIHRDPAASGIVLRVDIGNLGAAAAGTLRVTPAGAENPLELDVPEVPPGGRVTLPVPLPDAAFNDVALLSVVADADINGENNAARVVCFPPEEGRVEVLSLALEGRRAGSAGATLRVRLRSRLAERRDVNVLAGIAQSVAEKRLALDPGTIVEETFAVELPAPRDGLSEGPLSVLVEADRRELALRGALVNLESGPFKPQELRSRR